MGQTKGNLPVLKFWATQAQMRRDCGGEACMYGGLCSGRPGLATPGHEPPPTTMRMANSTQKV